MAKKLTSAKAKKILHDKSVHGHPLTEQQRKFFGAIAGGAKPYKAESGGWLDKFDEAQTGKKLTAPSSTPAKWIFAELEIPRNRTVLVGSGKKSSSPIYESASYKSYSDPRRGDMASTVKSNAQVERDYEVARLAGQAERIRKQGTISAADPSDFDPQPWYSKVWERAVNPIEAFSYSVKGQEIPDYFSTRRGTTGLNQLTQMINPAAWVDYGIKGAKDVGSGIYNIGEAVVTGDFGRIPSEALNVGLGALSVAGAMYPINKAGKFVKTQNPWRFKPQEGIMHRQIFGEEALENFQKYGPTSRPGVAPSQQLVDYALFPTRNPSKVAKTYSSAGENFETVSSIDDVGGYRVPYFSEGKLWHGKFRPNPGKEYLITADPKNFPEGTFVPAGESTIMMGNPSKALIESYAGSRRAMVPFQETFDPSKFKLYEPHWLRGYKEVKPKKKENGGWLDKYEQGGMVLKQKTKDNYGKKPNANNSDVSLPPGFVGLAYNTKGRNYSPAWGGQFAMGGSIPGAVGFTYARTAGAAPSNGPYAKKTKASAQDGKKLSYSEWKKQYNLKKTPDYNLKRAWELGYIPDEKGHLPTVDNQTGEFLKAKGHPTLQLELDWYNSPEAADFRSKNAIDSSGKFYKYVPKSQNGQEMKFYQEGLDFKPKTISQDGTVIDPMGYWNPENIGNPVIIPSNEITMQGVDQPLIGISDTGDVQYMEPGEDYTFDGEYVTEYPMAKGGISVNEADAQPIKKLDQLLNFTNYNKPTKGGWLDKYN